MPAKRRVSLRQTLAAIKRGDMPELAGALAAYFAVQREPVSVPHHQTRVAAAWRRLMDACPRPEERAWHVCDLTELARITGLERALPA